VNTKTIRTLILLFVCLSAMTTRAKFFSVEGSLHQASDSTSKGTGYKTVFVLLSDPEGIDWAPYLHEVYLSTKQKLTATGLPESAKRGEPGTVRIEFRIDRDGKVPEDSLFLITSGKKDMDDACLAAIRAAGPFNHLPETFHGPFIKLRQTVYFNVPKDSQGPAFGNRFDNRGEYW
jgi:TonB family protein